MNIAKRFSKNLRTAREASGLSLRKLAPKVNLTHVTLHDYEKGRTTPPVVTLIALCHALKVSVATLLDGCEQK